MQKAWTWQPKKTVLGLSAGHATPKSMETSFYRRSSTGEHQLYFIGYADAATCQASVYLAVAPDIAGPYTILPEPVVPRGKFAGRDVYLITSPSIVSHDGLLHMAFLGWNGFEDMTAVWSFGAVSSDAGCSWQNLREIAIPIGMEGQITPRPGRRYVATRITEFGNVEGISIACADHPFGPYTTSNSPALISAGPPWEVEEIIALQITFDRETGIPNLFYTGANHATGWWIMRAMPEK